ncbi:MAG: cysteine-rich CWC family protein [Rhodospirillales bacterium]|nr:MAG: cysteine-rich CWC family protein [Rhodospirillales bacterium]
MTSPTQCPNCGRRFNCEGSADCWCLKVERKFDYEAMILRTGKVNCVCPVCLTGRTDLAGIDSATERRESGC